MLRTTIIVLSEEERKTKQLSLEPLVRKAISEAVERQKSLGLPNYYIRNGRIYGRSPNGRFVSTKK